MTFTNYVLGLTFWIMFYSLLGAVARDVTIIACNRAQWFRDRR